MIRFSPDGGSDFEGPPQPIDIRCFRLARCDRLNRSKSPWLCRIEAYRKVPDASGKCGACHQIAAQHKSIGFAIGEGIEIGANARKQLLYIAPHAVGCQNTRLTPWREIVAAQPIYRFARQVFFEMNIEEPVQDARIAQSDQILKL